MGVARQAPTLTEAGLVKELKAEGKEKGEDELNKRLGVVKELVVSRFIVEINGDRAVFACHFGGLAYVSSPCRWLSVQRRHGEGNPLQEQAYGERIGASLLNPMECESYGAAKREIRPGVEHRQSRYLNNRCEHAHRPTRQREYRMQGFKSAGHAQRFLSAYGPIAQHFRPRRHLLSASAYRQEMRNRFESWAEMTGTERAA